jgi:hypothetical protein
MSRTAAITGSALLALGLAIFVWKTLGLGLPVTPSQPEGLWRVELVVSAQGQGRRGSVRVPLPSSGPGQVIFDEHASSDRLLFAIRTEGEQRIGVWSGRLAGLHEIVYGFRAELSEVQTPLPVGPLEEPPRSLRERFGSPRADLPADAPEIRAALDELRLPGPEDPAGRLRTIFAFVSDEIGEVATGSDHALLTLATREGSPEGQVRLLVSLLRGVGIPARPVLGLVLRPDSALQTEAWAEAWLGGEWIPMSPSAGFFATRPANLLALRAGSLDLVEAKGVDAVGHRYRGLREQLRPEELATMLVPSQPILARVSLHRLPLATQGVLRALLLFPLGVLVVSLFRNVVGFETFGTFMPILIAFALRSTSLAIGLAMVGAVIVLGILGRLVLERLRLLLVPRLSILLCLVVLAITALALAGEGLGRLELGGGVLFPIVILTMLVERFSVTMAEEGLRPALVRAGWSTLVAVIVYPIFRSALAEHLMFGFPELVVCTMGLLVWIGGYTGYRLTDLIRFRLFAPAPGAAGP